MRRADWIGRLVPRSPYARGALAVVAALIAYDILAGAINRLFPAPSGPAASAFATTPAGDAALAQVLARVGHPVTLLETPPAEASLDRRSTIFVLEPSGLSAQDERALARFVRGGGRLVAGGPSPGAWLTRLIPDAPRWTDAAAPLARAVAGAALPGDVRTVATTGGAFAGGARGTVQLRSGAGAILIARREGAGTAELLADISPLSNALLARRDDAALGVALAGAAGRPVIFDESVHGFAPSGLAAIPTRWKWGLGGLILAALLFAVARARRLGDPDVQTPPPAPARAAYIDAIAGTLSRSRDRMRATEPLREDALAALRRRAALSPDAGEQALREAAKQRGLSPALAAALLRAPRTDEDVLALGRAAVTIGVGGP